MDFFSRGLMWQYGNRELMEFRRNAVVSHRVIEGPMLDPRIHEIEATARNVLVLKPDLLISSLKKGDLLRGPVKKKHHLVRRINNQPDL